ncbi:hypothetical protein GCM10010520_59510 [Rhizobium viscosum]
MAAVAVITSGAFAQDEKEAALQKQMDALARVDPYMHAILVDHMDETRQVFDEFLQGRDVTAMQEALGTVAMMSGKTALSRASDTYAIGVLNKAVELVDVLIAQYPEGCRYFEADAIPREGLAIPAVAQRYHGYLEAKRLAYQDGRSREQVPRMVPKDMIQLTTTHLGLSIEDLQVLANFMQAPAGRLCSIIKRLNTIDPVPEAQRGDWARMTISWGG